MKKNKNKKELCKNCEHCKLIAGNDVVICDYLNKDKTLMAMFQSYARPVYCKNFNKKKKEKK